MGQPNRLRVVMHGDQIRVYLNGVLTTSLRDRRFSAGLVRLVISPGTRSSGEVASSDLQLREADSGK
jgi:predicted membrane-bound spermidine synthase